MQSTTNYIINLCAFCREKCLQLIKQTRAGFFNLFLKGPLYLNKNAMTPSNNITQKKQPLKTPKNFFCWSSSTQEYLV